MKDFGYICWNLITNLATLYCSGACMWENDSAAGGDLEKYHVATEHVYITDLIWLKDNPVCLGAE
jgi:hypothetical protein